jgi:hypothetical protein
MPDRAAPPPASRWKEGRQLARLASQRKARCHGEYDWNGRSRRILAADLVSLRVAVIFAGATLTESQPNRRLWSNERGRQLRLALFWIDNFLDNELWQVDHKFS